MLQEALEQKQAEVLGRRCYERCGATASYCHGSEDGTLEMVEGVRRVKVPQVLTLIDFAREVGYILQQLCVITTLESDAKHWCTGGEVVCRGLSRYSMWCLDGLWGKEGVREA